MRTLAMVIFGVLVGASCGTDDGGGGDDPPAAPTGVSVARLGGGGHVTWTDNADNEEEFMIMRKEGAGSYIELGRVTFDSTQYHDEPLTTGTSYTYMVMALNAGGQAESNEATYVHQ